MIDYTLISEAMAFYKSKGFNQIEVPWLVSRAAIDATKPPNLQSMEARGHANSWGHLVGSGEQGFIQLMLDGKLAHGAYVTATPCFRDEQVLSELNQLHFFKVELIFNLPPHDYRINAVDAVMGMIGTAEKFMKGYLPVVQKHRLKEPEKNEKPHEAFADIMYEDIELGSYDLRRWNEFRWVYGTGLAEPRFSIARRQYNADVAARKAWLAEKVAP